MFNTNLVYKIYDKYLHMGFTKQKFRSFFLSAIQTNYSITTKIIFFVSVYTKILRQLLIPMIDVKGQAACQLGN